MYDRDGIIRMVGAVIRCAINDYQSDYVKRKRKGIWATANSFLFGKDRLEDFLKKYEMNDIANCNYIRGKAMYKIHNIYYVPKSKNELIKNILPQWKGSKTELRQYSIQRLRAVFHRLRQDTINNLMKKD